MIESLDSLQAPAPVDTSYVRRDRRGRRIGRNWYRELAVETWRGEYDAWQQLAEEHAIGYATELIDFKLEHPTPTFKATLIGLRQDVTS